LGASFCDDGVWLLQPAGDRTWVALDSTAACPLEPGVVIEIPFCREWIAVTGAVERPGYYPYLPGQTAADYVHLAGGPSGVGRDDGWKVVIPGTESRDASPGDPIVAGTRIWIPERRSYKISRILTPLGTAVALIVSVVALTSAK
jgi:hypothetical protein